MDALLAKTNLGPDERSDLEQGSEDCVFSNKCLDERSSLRAHARWALGKWRRRQGRLEEALAAFEAVELGPLAKLGARRPTCSRRMRGSLGTGAWRDCYWITRELAIITVGLIRRLNIHVRR